VLEHFGTADDVERAVLEGEPERVPERKVTGTSVSPAMYSS